MRATIGYCIIWIGIVSLIWWSNKISTDRVNSQVQQILNDPDIKEKIRIYHELKAGVHHA